MSIAQQKQCTACPLNETRTQVVLPDPPTKGSLNLFAVGEAPGADEDREGVGFVGSAGRRLEELFKNAIAERPLERNEFGRANMVCCRPPGNRDPKRSEKEACAPWLQEAMTTRFNVDVILAVGRVPSLYFYSCKTLEEAIAKAEEQSYTPDVSWAADAGIKVIPSPHSSPLALNRYVKSTGESWKAVALRQVAMAIQLAENGSS